MNCIEYSLYQKYKDDPRITFLKLQREFQREDIEKFLSMYVRKFLDKGMNVLVISIFTEDEMVIEFLDYVKTHELVIISPYYFSGDKPPADAVICVQTNVEEYWLSELEDRIIPWLGLHTELVYLFDPEFY